MVCGRYLSLIQKLEMGHKLRVLIRAGDLWLHGGLTTCSVCMQLTPTDSSFISDAMGLDTKIFFPINLIRSPKIISQMYLKKNSLAPIFWIV